MAMKLPAVIADYFDADGKADGNAIMRYFTEDARVTDEGRTYVGPDAIRDWKAASSARYSYTAEPVAIAEEGGTSVVTAHVVGDFPGSPADLRYRFVLDGECIAELEIGA